MNHFQQLVRVIQLLPTHYYKAFSFTLSLAYLSHTTGFLLYINHGINQQPLTFISNCQNTPLYVRLPYLSPSYQRRQT